MTIASMAQNPLVTSCSIDPKRKKKKQNTKIERNSGYFRKHKNVTGST